jgi:hypothetical protein
MNIFSLTFGTFESIGDSFNLVIKIAVVGLVDN